MHPFKEMKRNKAMEKLPGYASIKLVHLHYLMIEVTQGGKDVHILVIKDYFMWYVQALITSSQTVKCTAQTFWDTFIVHYGLPESIVSDQGQNF